MTERERLVARWKEAADLGQFDIADEYFQAALEAGAKEFDAVLPGTGEPWRRIGRLMAELRPRFIDG